MEKILFDLDDTLAHCNKYFDIVLDQFADELLTWFAAYPITEDEVKRKQLEIDIRGVEIHGFSTDHFPQSLVDTYKHYASLTGRPVSKHEEELLRKLGSSVYDQEVEPYPNMRATLDVLMADGHELHLYTGGVAKMQMKKVEKLELHHYFGDRIYIRQHKTTSTLEDILHQGHFDREHTWMIGNSLRTDITPALETGIHCIYIPAKTEWQFNMVHVNAKPKGAFLTLQSLVEVPKAISLYLSTKSS